MQERGDTRSNKEDRQKFFEIDCKQEEIQDRMEKIEKKKFEIDCKQKKIEIEWRRSTKISWDRLQARGDTRSNEEDRQKFLEIECNNQEIQDRLQEIESQKLKNGRRSNRRKSTRKKGSRKKFVESSNWNFCWFSWGIVVEGNRNSKECRTQSRPEEHKAMEDDTLWRETEHSGFNKVASFIILLKIWM